jgi:citrate lyase subunit beta/citryl-CoA lyase
LVVLDLEDAVKPGDKEEARRAAVEAVSSSWPMPVAIRVNGVGSEWHSLDLDAVAGANNDFAVLPRAASAQDIRQVKGAFGKPVLAMVETAAGVLAAGEIAEEAAALVAGTNDLRSDLRLPLDATREPISTALQMIVLAARANNIPAFDGVYNRLKDLDGFIAECMHGRSLGFDGKSLIHPDQIGPCNEAFGPSEDEVESARRLVEAFTGGAERFEDRMIERMHVEAARRVLERAGS